MIRQVLILLPTAALPALFFVLLGSATSPDHRSENWRSSFLAAAVLWGLAVALGSELLGALGQLGWVGIASLWLILDVVLLIYGLRSGKLQRGLRGARERLEGITSWPWADRLPLAGLAAMAALLLAIAAVAPANTIDSLRYHLPRIAHWLQDGSLNHYAASYHNQLWSPPWSELAILHLMALWGGDRLANLVQWSTMVGSALAISAIAREIGASRRGQLLSAVFGLTAPMAVLQATSTQTDYVVGFWILTTVLLLLRLVRRQLTTGEWVLLGGALGLGMLAKATFYPYVGLLLIGAFALAWRRGGSLRPLLRGGLILTVVAVVSNIGFWSRNLTTYGTPLGSPEMVSKNTSARFDPRSLVSNSIQHLALNLPTPSEPLNEGIITAVRSASEVLGQPKEDYRILWSWNHEDLAGSPLHISLIGLAVVLALGRRRAEGRERLYAGAILLSFLAYAWTVDSGVYRVRYQLPILLMGAPLVGAVASRWLPAKAQTAVGLALMLLALPWLLVNQTRPVVGWRPRTRTESVFMVSREAALFANVPELRSPFSKAVEAVSAGGCRQVGLSIDSNDLEYLFWWLLGAPESGVEIRVVRPLESLRPLVRDEFAPCAVICTNCGSDTFDGLPLQADYGSARVYAEASP